MQMNLRVRFFTEVYGWLCFKHATTEALAGREVKTEIDDYDSEYYMGTTWCQHPDCK